MKQRENKKGTADTVVLLVDGSCALCHGMTRFAVRRDKHNRFRIASLDSVVGRRLLAHAGIPEPSFDSMVLLERGRVYVKSDAALRVMRGLNGLWPLAFAAIVVPRPVRNLVYDLIARFRYRMFGRADACMLPAAAGSDRFIKDDEPIGSVCDGNEPTRTFAEGSDKKQ